MCKCSDNKRNRVVFTDFLRGKIAFHSTNPDRQFLPVSAKIATFVRIFNHIFADTQNGLAPKVTYYGGATAITYYCGHKAAIILILHLPITKKTNTFALSQEGVDGHNLPSGQPPRRR